jgi:hypothetical protein
MKYRSMAVVLPLALLSMGGCGSDSSDDVNATVVSEDPNTTEDGGGDVSAQTTLSLSGKVIDGYIENASVFVDLNGNLQLDGDEPQTSTDSNGSFSFNGVEVPAGSYRVIATGGTDTLTGSLFEESLFSVVEINEEGTELGGYVVSPISTLITESYFTENISLESAEEKISTILEINQSVDILHTDFIEAGINGDTDLFYKNQDVMLSLRTISTTLENSGTTEEDAYQVAVKNVVEQSSLDLQTNLDSFGLSGDYSSEISIPTSETDDSTEVETPATDTGDENESNGETVVTEPAEPIDFYEEMRVAQEENEKKSEDFREWAESKDKDFWVVETPPANTGSETTEEGIVVDPTYPDGEIEVPSQISEISTLVTDKFSTFSETASTENSTELLLTMAKVVDITTGELKLEALKEIDNASSLITENTAQVRESVALLHQALVSGNYSEDENGISYGTFESISFSGTLKIEGESTSEETDPEEPIVYEDGGTPPAVPETEGNSTETVEVVENSGEETTATDEGETPPAIPTETTVEDTTTAETSATGDLSPSIPTTLSIKQLKAEIDTEALMETAVAIAENMGVNIDDMGEVSESMESNISALITEYPIAETNGTVKEETTTTELSEDECPVEGGTESKTIVYIDGNENSTYDDGETIVSEYGSTVCGDSESGYSSGSAYGDAIVTAVDDAIANGTVDEAVVDLISTYYGTAYSFSGEIVIEDMTIELTVESSYGYTVVSDLTLTKGDITISIESMTLYTPFYETIYENMYEDGVAIPEDGSDMDSEASGTCLAGDDECYETGGETDTDTDTDMERPITLPEPISETEVDPIPDEEERAEAVDTMEPETGMEVEEEKPETGIETETEDGAETETEDGTETETKDGAETETKDGAETETEDETETASPSAIPPQIPALSSLRTLKAAEIAIINTVAETTVSVTDSEETPPMVPADDYEVTTTVAVDNPVASEDVEDYGDSEDVSYIYSSMSTKIEYVTESGERASFTVSEATGTDGIWDSKFQLTIGETVVDGYMSAWNDKSVSEVKITGAEEELFNNLTIKSFDDSSDIEFSYFLFESGYEVATKDDGKTLTVVDSLGGLFEQNSFQDMDEAVEE